MFLDQLKSKLHEKESLFIGEDTAFRSAILIPLVQVEDEWHILFEVRSLKMRRQPGDISFPGGRIDTTDESPLAAALRETSEELGVDRKNINLVGKLSPYVTSPSFVVYPYVAQINYKEIIQSYNKAEVEEVFIIPVEWLLNYRPYMHKVTVELSPSSDFPYEKIMNGNNYQWGTRTVEEWFYDYEKYTIWGLTARILKHFLEVIDT